VTLKRVLIVDDNRALAENLAEILEAEGIEATVFSDPLEAREHAAAIEYDAALLDVRMPGIDGVDLCHALRRHHPDAPHLLMTAFAGEERLETAMSCARKVLWKPFGPQELLDALRAIEEDD